MAVIDLTLESFQVPALAQYNPPVGTKKESGGLSTQEVNDNIMMPWLKQRPIEIIEVSTTKASGAPNVNPVQFNPFLMFTATTRVSMTLEGASFIGCRAVFMNMSSVIQDVSVLNGVTYDAHTVHPHEQNTFIWNGSAWYREEDYGFGESIGSAIPIGSSAVPSGKILADGALLNIDDYPRLYREFGTTHNLTSDNDPTKFRIPDMRECVLVGAGQSTRAILDTTGHAHDVYTLGEFKDDQIQDHTHSWQGWNGVGRGDTVNEVKSRKIYQQDPNEQGTLGIFSGRKGTTTHGKQLGMTYVIKY